MSVNLPLVIRQMSTSTATTNCIDCSVQIVSFSGKAMIGYVTSLAITITYHIFLGAIIFCDKVYVGSCVTDILKFKTVPYISSVHLIFRADILQNIMALSSTYQEFGFK